LRILKLPGTEHPALRLRRNDLLTCGGTYFHALLIGEALATTGGEPWDSYQRTLESALVSIPNRDGSWPLPFVASPKRPGGTSVLYYPSFVTATAVQCLTLRNRQEELRRAGRPWRDGPKAADDEQQQTKSGTADRR
jgi:hypothetical protein